MRLTISVPLVLTLPVLALGWFAGGWPWAAMLLLAALIASRQESNTAALVMSALAALWILAFWIAGDRRFFFPYTMLLTVYAASLPQRAWLQVLAGAGLVEAFLCIRMWQDASQEVLIFESLVAMFLLAFGLVAASQMEGKRAWIASFGSLLALLSLAL
jgi:hypothetical protein